MHEMAIASSVLESVLRHAEGRRVTHVQLRVGHLRQVVPSSLEFGWEVLSRGTVADGAVLGIEKIEAVGACRSCGEETPQRGFPFRCGACGEYGVEVVRGDELLIDYLEVDDPVPAPT
ncbi:MAG: hydrogenase maturation nickel metallochaperone HypA [Gemmatimonadales bacterium]|jgi:hydrogenase nickel incorporation protein HypA/HybF